MRLPPIMDMLGVLGGALAHRIGAPRTVMIGGDVRKGEPYGYIHWRGDEGVWLLRNPGLEPDRALRQRCCYLPPA